MSNVTPINHAAATHATLAALSVGDKVRISAHGLKRPRVVTVTATPERTGDGFMVGVSSRRTWGDNIDGGVLVWNPGRNAHVAYQPTLMQSVRLVLELEAVAK